MLYDDSIIPGEKENAMKLSYKRTIFVGFAFFLICAFWQAYDNTIPLILTNKFGLPQRWSGLIMALDNILAHLRPLQKPPRPAHTIHSHRNDCRRGSLFFSLFRRPHAAG